LRQKATAARPPANTPALAVVPSPAAGAATVKSLGQQLRDLLPPRRLHSVSLCDHEANVLWLSEGALGPDEHTVIMDALGLLDADHSLHCHEAGLEDGRHALFLPVRSPTAELVGIAMILADNKSVGDDTQERVATGPVRAIMQRLAVLMKPSERKAAAPVVVDEDTLPPMLLELVPELPAAPESPAPRAQGAAPHPAAKAAAAKQPAPKPAESQPAISARQVNDLLEFDLALDEVAAPPPRRAPLSGETSSEMMNLEFLAEAPVPVLPPGPIAPPQPLMGMAPLSKPRVLAPPVAPATATKPAQPVTPAVLPAPVVAAPVTAAPAAAEPVVAAAEAVAAVAVPAPAATAAAAPAAMPAAASDANLILEVLPYTRLRAGGQTRRFQIQPRTAASHRDPAALDALILQRVLAWLAAHRSAWSAQPTTFTVGLSIASLEDQRFVQKIAAALNAHGISPETVGFEITEAVCTQRRAQVEHFLNQCEKIGSWVVIDDFSFDSQVLPLLRSKALRLLKINSKLTSSALKDKMSQALVVATVQAAKVMGIHCGAKKVDSQAGLQWLTAIGLDFAQGAAAALPQPLEALAAPAN
jgi:EAL domain-containing protein (putative c-di-GMP-specific phosphodiesterase class I)